MRPKAVMERKVLRDIRGGKWGRGDLMQNTGLNVQTSGHLWPLSIAMQNQ